MRAATRIISAILALVLAAAAGVAVVEAVAALVGAGPLVIPADRWLRAGRATSWNDVPVQLALAGVALVGLALVLFALWPRRMFALRTDGDGFGVELYVERRSLERALAERVDRVDGVRSSEAHVGKNKVVVDVRSTARADGVDDGARRTVTDVIERYGIDLTDRITINLRRRAA